ncbi:class I SAM-dependent methyltransferase [Buchananella hordeovulneris]|nr:class I SAM-dependent methyltransferase [Buchananella hordeovulneris]
MEYGQFAVRHGCRGQATPWDSLTGVGERPQQFAEGSPVSDDINYVTGGYDDLSPAEQEATVAATGRWWDGQAAEYYAEHGKFLGDTELTWCVEGWRERDVELLGPVAGRDVVEIGAGAAQGSRYLAGQGARVVATDISAGMLAQARALNERHGVEFPLVVADARALPLADESADVCFTAYGAIPFVPDPERIHAEVARVLRPGGRWVFSTSHPVRWMFPDTDSEAGLTISRSYFDTRPYVERQGEQVVYAEHHRPVSAHVADVLAAGLQITGMWEPTWRAGRSTWGGWGPRRGELMPGTLIIAARKPTGAAGE